MTKVQEESKTSLVYKQPSDIEDLDLQVSSGLILRLYETLRMNRKLQSGIKRIEQFSAPIIEKYHNYVDENIDKVKTKLTDWVSSVNIYNHLVGLWLYQNKPFTGTVAPLNGFIQSFEALGKIKNEEKVKNILLNFYKITSAVWTSLKNPSNEDLRNALLDAVAKTLNKNLGLETDTFSTGLYTTFKMIIESNKEFVVEEAYIESVRQYLGDEFWMKNETNFIHASREFYTFAKRFVLIDFPPCYNKRMRKVLMNYIKDTTFKYGDLSLDYIEDQMKKIYSYLKIEHEPVSPSLNFTKRVHRLFTDLQILAQVGFQFTLNKVTSNKFYIKVNELTGFETRAISLYQMAEHSYQTTKVKFIEPTIDYIRTSNKMIKDKITITFEGLNLDLVKTQFNNIRKKYHILKDTTAIITQNILSIVFDKQALMELGTDAKSELIKIYNELKSLDLNRAKNLGSDLYKRALLKLNELKQVKSIEPVKAIEMSSN